MFSTKIDNLLKSLQGRHRREACPRPDRGAGVSRRGGIGFPGFPRSRE